MNDGPSSCLQLEVHHQINWTYVFLIVRSTEGAEDELKNSGVASLTFLRKELGRGFFNNCGRDHPVYQKLMLLGSDA